MGIEKFIDALGAGGVGTAAEKHVQDRHVEFFCLGVERKIISVAEMAAFIEPAPTMPTSTQRRSSLTLALISRCANAAVPLMRFRIGGAIFLPQCALRAVASAAAGRHHPEPGRAR
jgi:hypothetical protein